MTQQARVVLQDCKWAALHHNDDLGGEAFRVSWVAIVTLLRAVGHVLSKVDSKMSPEMHDAIDEWWAGLQSSKPEPVIFWQFIEDERNRTVKLYDYWVERRLTIDGPVINGRQIVISVDKARSRGGGLTSDSGRITTRISQGPFKGLRERDLALQAIDWWRTQLDQIDARVVILRSS